MSKGWPKGRPRPQSEETKRKIAESQKRRWATEEGRASSTQGAIAAWQTGSRAKDRVEWTPEMDAELRRLYGSMPFRQLRTEGAAAIGVSEQVLRTRLKILGLRKRRPRALNDASKRRRGAPRSGSTVVVSVELSKKQKDADDYVSQLLATD